MPRQLIHRGRKIEVYIDTAALPDGTTVQRDIIVHPGAVVILPLVDNSHVCLLRNERPIVGETLWELPAGTLEPAEPPEQAAVRELVEETGYTAAHWRKLCECYASPGCLTERFHLFAAEVLTPGVSRPERDEHLEPHVIPWEQAIAWTLDGTIRDSKTIAGLLMWDRLRRSAT